MQDGLDGLLSSVSVIGSSAWGLIAVFVTLAGASALSPEYIGNYQHLAIFAMALAGGCMGFLRFNHYPALVFMGDTGSMFIGGAMVGMSMLLRMPLYWLLICFTMFASSMSVIIQRIYFKVTHGKRIFKMLAHSSSFRTERHDRTADRGDVLRCGGSFVPDRSVLPSPELTDSIVFCGFRR